MNNNLFPISKEGWAYVGYSVVLFLVLGFLDLEFLQFFSFILIIFFVYTYRNPERQILALEKGGIVSPADGKIADIIKKDNSIDIIIESSYSDVSVLRAPIAATVKSVKLKRGASLSKNSPKAEKLNEKLEIELECDKNRSVSISHLSTMSFSNISHDLLESKKLIQGSRYGVMVKGITTITLPSEVKLSTAIGAQVKGCESTIAYLS